MSGRLTLCSNSTCGLAATCWRATTRPEPRDNVMLFQPLAYSTGGAFCGFYEPPMAIRPMPASARLAGAS